MASKNTLKLRKNENKLISKLEGVWTSINGRKIDNIPYREVNYEKVDMYRKQTLYSFMNFAKLMEVHK